MKPVTAVLICCLVMVSSCSGGEQPTGRWNVAVQGLFAAAVSTDARLVIAGSMNHGTSVWQMPEFERLYDWRHRSGENLELVAAAFSPDGTRAVTCDPRTLVLWDTSSGNSLQFWGLPGAAQDLAVMPNGHEVLLGLEDHSALLFDAADGSHRRTFLHEGVVSAVALSADGKLALTGADDNAARLWSVETGTLLFRFNHSSPVRTVAISPDGKRLFTAATNAEVRLWDAETGKVLQRISDRNSSITQAAFAADGSFVLTAELGGQIDRISVASGRRERSWRLPGADFSRRRGTGVLALNVTPNGRSWAVSGDGWIISLD
ncbi:MAG: PQQ-binding-like beta-propeller repeat protein [Pseudomonadales bacterium]